MSVEEQVEEYYKAEFNRLGIHRFTKTEGINKSVSDALKAAVSKGGGSGNNYPDIQLLLTGKYSRSIPVMIEAKGSKNKLEALDKDGHIVQVTKYGSDSKPGAKNPHKKGDPNYSKIQAYAVNGALHYGLAILNNSDNEEVIVMGINGTQTKNGRVSDPEQKAYYVAKKNNCVPKHIPFLDKSLDLLKTENLDGDNGLFARLDRLSLTEKEFEELKAHTEDELESKIKKIHQAIYDDKSIQNELNTSQKLFLFTGLIMAGLHTEGVNQLTPSELKGNTTEYNNDGKVVLNHIRDFLNNRNAEKAKIDMIANLLSPIFAKESLWRPDNGESLIRKIYQEVYEDIIPLLESNLHLDFTGKILNSLNDWVTIENDKRNDVVLTPRYVTNLMAKLARTNKDSFVWDLAMGSAGFLVSAMDLMIKDAKNTIQDQKKLEEKIKSIKQKQLLGVEILGNIYVLAILNMILMGDGSTHMINGNSHDLYSTLDFPANVFLLNPPYSAEGKGLTFVKEALSQMTKGYAAILIQENAGSGQGLPYAKDILESNTLEASIHMPTDLFGGKASVQTAIYVFQVARPHEKDDMVTFIDFSKDGYTRQNRKKSSQAVNLRDTDYAQDRYDEILAIVTNKKPKTSYYTEKNGLVVKDTISLKGDDWTFAQHKKIDITPTEEDFKKTVADYLAWKVSTILKEGE